MSPPVLRFDDGVEVDTSGEYRTLELHDGWYVVGRGNLIPCDDQANAIKTLDGLKQEINKQ